MKDLNLSFRHPVKGKARFFAMFDGISKCKSIFIDSKDSNDLQIPLKDLENGKWKMFFDWKYQGRNYSYTTELEINQTGSML